MLIAVVSLTAGATSAYFSDTENSADNEITAGTLTFGSPVDVTWTSDDLAPGDEVTGLEGQDGVKEGYNFNIGNAGSIDADHVEIGPLSNIVTPVYTEGADMDAKLIVTSLKYRARTSGPVIDLLSMLKTYPTLGEVTYGSYKVRIDGGGTFGSFLDGGELTLASWEANSGRKLEIADNTGGTAIPEGLAGGTKADFDLDFEFDEDAGNDYQGAEVDTTLTFTLNQDSSQ